MANFKELYAGDYLKAEDVKEKPFKGVIQRVEPAEMNDGKEKVVVYFEGRKRGLVLNGTRYDQIVEITKTHETDNWIGTPLLVYAGKTNFGGKRVDCLVVGSPKVKSEAQKRREIKAALDGDDIPEHGDPLPKNGQLDEDDDEDM
jgi:hypothetical protein